MQVLFCKKCALNFHWVLKVAASKRLIYRYIGSLILKIQRDNGRKLDSLEKTGENELLSPVFRVPLQTEYPLEIALRPAKCI